MIPLHDWLMSRQSRPFEISTPLLPEAPLEAAMGETDVEALIAEAVVKAQTEAEQNAEARFSLALAEQALKHQENLQLAKELAFAEQLENLRSTLSDCFANLHEQLAREVAAVLQGLITPAVETEALDAFRSALIDFAENEPLVRLEGPDELISALLRLGPLPAGVEVRAGAAAAIRAVAGDSAIELQLRKWIEAIRGDAT